MFPFMTSFLSNSLNRLLRVCHSHLESQFKSVKPRSQIVKMRLMTPCVLRFIISFMLDLENWFLFSYLIY